MKKIGLFLSIFSLSFALISQELQHDVTVTLKLIQVMVTDKEGNPVTDLRQDDFRLFDNGLEQALSEFEKHDIKLPRRTVLPVESDPRPTRTPLEPAAPILNRKFFLFFDFAWTDFQMIRKFRETALNFMDESLLPTDEVSVLSFTGMRQLQVHFFQTTEHEKVRRYFGDLGLKDASGRAETEEESYQQDLEAGGQPDSRPDTELMLPFPDTAAENMFPERLFKSRWYLDNLMGLALALRYVPGQKHLILISGGISPGIYGHPLTRDKAENLIKELNNSNVTVFSLRAAPMSIAPDYRTGASTLQKWAYETGGRYFGNFFKADEHVNQIKILTGTYYVLGFPVSETWDGKYHKIKVKVSRPGCKVRAQKGYFNPKTFSRYSDLEKTMHLVDLALAERPLSQIPARFEMNAIPYSLDPEGSLLFSARLPAGELRKIFQGKVEVATLIFNARDEIVVERKIEEDLTPFTDKDIFFLCGAEVEPGSYRCRIVIRDLVTGAAAVAGSSADVSGPDEAATLSIFPPVLLKPEKGGHYIVGIAPGSMSNKIPLSGFADSLLFNPTEYVPLIEKCLVQDTDYLASVSAVVPGGPEATVRLSAVLFDKIYRQEIPVPLDIIRRAGEGLRRTFLIRFRVPVVDEDDYTLILTAEDSRSGEISNVLCDFLIREETDAENCRVNTSFSSGVIPVFQGMSVFEFCFSRVEN